MFYRFDLGMFVSSLYSVGYVILISIVRITTTDRPTENRLAFSRAHLIWPNTSLSVNNADNSHEEWRTHSIIYLPANQLVERNAFNTAHKHINSHKLQRCAIPLRCNCDIYGEKEEEKKKNDLKYPFSTTTNTILWLSSIRYNELSFLLLSNWVSERLNESQTEPLPQIQHYEFKCCLDESFYVKSNHSNQWIFSRCVCNE